jgi:hypothetical protein
MIHAVPEGISRAARQMVMRHPNTMQCVVYRKKVLRESDSEVGGLPTLGGIGVLDSEDETAYEFEELGEGRIIFSGVYGATSGNMNDSGDGVTYAEGAMECRVEPVVPGNGFVIPYEVVGITSPTSIPPYVRKLIVECRQDELVGI